MNHETTGNSMEPRVHADLIKQWADGAEIQRFEYTCGWNDTVNPQWRKDMQYRVKQREFEVGSYYKAVRDGRNMVAYCLKAEDTTVFSTPNYGCTYKDSFDSIGDEITFD